ncbi:hypothetical protein B0H19DRAFT_1071258 [Mycena capillaripes]|nr:hypothetical protein B0H19DRAFT_1071258 [Mycena capillaripes]
MPDREAHLIRGDETSGFSHTGHTRNRRRTLLRHRERQYWEYHIAHVIQCLEGLEVTFYKCPDTVSEHLKSPVLFKITANRLQAATLLPTSSVQLSSSGVTDKDLRDSMPTYGKAQFESCTRQYSPFCARQETWSRTTQYWQAISQLPEASVLAIQFVAIKIFSILPNSMAEERTVSRFTRNDTVDRTSQDTSTIVAMTKIYQHNQHLAAASTAKPRRMKGLMKEPEPIRTVAATPTTTTATSSDTITPITRTAGCEDGLAAVNFVHRDGTAPTTSPSFADTEISSERDGPDINLSFFRDLLSKKPIPGAEIGSLADWCRWRGAVRATKRQLATYVARGSRKLVFLAVLAPAVYKQPVYKPEIINRLYMAAE